MKLISSISNRLIKHERDVIKCKDVRKVILEIHEINNIRFLHMKWSILKLLRI